MRERLCTKGAKVYLRILLAVLVAWCVEPTSARCDEPEINLWGAIELARTNQLRLLAMDENLRSSQARVEQANASGRADLQLDLRYRLFDGRDDFTLGEDPLGTNSLFSDGEGDLYSASIIFNTKLFQKGYHRSLTQIAQLRSQQLELGREGFDQEFDLLVASRYFELLFLRASHQLALARLDIASANGKRARILRENGKASAFDMERVELQLGRAKTKEVLRRREYESQIARFGRLVNPTDTNAEAPDVAGTLEFHPVDLSADVLLERARELRVELRDFELLRSIAEQGVEAERKAIRPALSLVGFYERRNEDLGQSGQRLNGTFDSFAAGIDFRVPLSGFRLQKMKVSEIEHGMRQADYEEKELDQSIGEQVLEALANLAFHREEIELLSLNIERAGRVVETAELLYSQGKGQILDVIGAQETMDELLHEHLASVHAYHQVQVELARATGDDLRNLLHQDYIP